MATFKHISSKNADYGAAEQYLTFEHDEFTMKPTLDGNGQLVIRDDYRISSLNCGEEDFAIACMRSNLKYGKNQKREDVKSHHYIISFDPRDAPDNGLTVDRAQALGEEFCKTHFPGHQALVCTHPDGHNHSGNIHVHIVINSLRIAEVPLLPYMERPADTREGCKHRCTDAAMEYFKAEVMEMCHRENTEQLPFKVPPKTKVIEEMAPPKSNGRKLPITELARPFFLKQLAMQEVQKEQAAKDGKPYYDNDLVVAKPDGAPIAASWVSSQFGKLLEDLDMPHIRFHDLRHTAATNMHQLTGDFYTVGEVLGHTLAGIGASLGLSMNFEAVTARYVDVRLERKKEVLDAYHSAVEKAAPEKPKEAEPKKGKRAAKKKHSEIDL